MALTPESRLRDAIVQVLGELGGAARRRDALARMEALLNDELTVQDRGAVASRPFEQRWMNNASYAREHMKGDLLTVRSDGVWELSDAGWTRFAALAGEGEADAADLLADFQPKDASDYVSRVRGQVLTKSREHEALIETFGKSAAAAGYSVSTKVHPRDLVLDNRSEHYLVEAKVLYRGNATEAVRSAVGQLFEYRHFLYEPGAAPVAVALFSEPIGDAFVTYLTTLGILSVWRAPGQGFDGSVAACRAGLARE